MRVFEYKFDDYTDWVAAESREESDNFYMKHSGNYDLDGYKIRELENDDLDNFYITDPNEMYDEDIHNEIEHEFCGNYKIVETFRQAVERIKIPDIIATTEF